MAYHAPYLWINKDQKNIKERLYDFQINSFVQKQRKIHKKKRCLKLQASIKARHLPWGFREVNSVPNQDHNTCVPGPDDTKIIQEFDDSEALVLGIRHTQPDLTARQQVCIFPSRDELDPFLPLAGTITQRDRCLLHYYLSVTPAAVYGTAKSAEDCVVRDQTVKFVQMNNTWLHWVLLLADRTRLGPAAAEKSPIVLARRTYLYRKMYEMVADAKTRHLDITITALAFAAWAEARSSGLERAQNHLLGVTHLVQGRGGLLILPLIIGHPIVYPFIWVGIGTAAFPNAKSLEYAISSFLYLTKSMRDLHRQYHQDMIRPDAAKSQAHHRRLQAYTQARSQAFGPLSALRPFLQVPFFDSTNRIQMRSHVALLWSLNKTLWEMRSDLSESSLFLRELDRRITVSDPTAQYVKRAVTGPLNAAEMQRLGLTGRKPTSKASAAVHIFANCLIATNWSAPVLPGFRDARVLRWYDSTIMTDDDMDTPPVVSLCETADVVELLQFLSADSRQKVLDQLSAWLLGDGDGDDQSVEPSDCAILSVAEFENIAEEMRCAWVKADEDAKVWTI